MTKTLPTKYWKYVIPSMINMLIVASYYFVDGLFIGQAVGENGLAAIQLSWPVVIIYTAIADLVGIGTGILISHCKGKNDFIGAKSFVGNMILADLLLYGLLSFLLIPNLKFIYSLLGADDNLLEFGILYSEIIMFGGIITMLLSGFASVIRNDNHPTLSMIITSGGLCLNGVLDYVLIFKYGLGIKGAAFATILSQVIAVIFCLIYFVFYSKILKFAKQTFLFSFLKLKQIIITGLPSLGHQLSIVLMDILINYQALKYAKAEGLAAYGFVITVISIASLMATGVATGIQPLLSYEFGKYNKKNQQYFFKLGCLTVIMMGFMFNVIFFVLNDYLISCFHLNGIASELARTGLLICSSSLIFLGLNRVSCSYFQSTNKIAISSFLTYGDALIIWPLTVILLPILMGINGVWFSMPVSRIIVFLFVIYFYNLNGNKKLYC